MPSREEATGPVLLKVNFTVLAPASVTSTNSCDPTYGLSFVMLFVKPNVIACAGVTPAANSITSPIRQAVTPHRISDIVFLPHQFKMHQPAHRTFVLRQSQWRSGS